MANALRTPEMIDRYTAYKAKQSLGEACALCAKPALHTFMHWRIVTNDFPYDLVAAEHDMLVPLRHVTEQQLTDEEQSEFARIKKEFIQQRYDNIIEGTHRTKSIPEHFHLHLIVGK